MHTSIWSLMCISYFNLPCKLHDYSNFFVNIRLYILAENITMILAILHAALGENSTCIFYFVSYNIVVASIFVALLIN